MLGKRTRPAIERLAGAIRSSGIVDSMTSPRSPLECKMQSPKGLKNYDIHQGGIGLGIVVALDKMTNSGGEILAKYAICGQFSARSSPIPVNPYGKNDKIGCNGKLSTKEVMVEMEGLDEELTYVTCHGPNKSITTRVYYDDGEYCKIGQNVVVGSVFNIAPTTTLINCNDTGCATGSGSGSDSDFLSSCHLCRKTLHGKDIYMYRGEKAFCSTECRQRQIGIDERKEKCRSEASRTSGDVVSSSPCTYSSRGQIFFSPGIVAV